MKKSFLFLLFSFFAISIGFSKSSEIDLGEIFTVIQKPEKTELYISAAEIEKSSAQDLCELFRENGILMMNTGGSGTTSNLSIKGYAGFCCKVYIDGVLATQPGTGEFDWNSIDINSVESITVSEIPDFDTDQFAGAVVKIKTKFFSGFGFNLKTSVTSFETSPFDSFDTNVEFRNTIDKFAFKLNVMVKNSDNNYRTPSDKILEGNWSKLGNLGFAFNNQFDDTLSLSGTSKFFLNHVKAFNTGVSNDVGIEKDFNSFNSIKIRKWTKDFGIYEASLTSQFNNIDYQQTKESRENTKMHSLDFLATITNLKGFDFSFLFSREDKITGKTAERNHITFKTQYTWDLVDWIGIKANLGIVSDFKNILLPLPQITVYSKKTGLSSSIFRQFILPTFNQLYWEGSGGVGNPDLLNEDGWSFMASWKSPLKFFPIDITYTRSYYGNKIRWTTNSLGQLQPQNTLDATYDSINAKSKFSIYFADVTLGATWTSAKLATGKQIMWVPEWQANANVVFHIKKISDINLNYVYTGKRFSSNLNLTSLDPIHDLSIGANFHLNEKWLMMFSINNVLDQKVYYHDAYPVPSRSYTVGFLFKQ